MDIIIEYYRSHFDDNQSDFTCFVSCSIVSLLLTPEEVTYGSQIYTRKVCRKINLCTVFFIKIQNITSYTSSLFAVTEQQILTATCYDL